MNSSPLTSWEGVGAYFTFADNPVVVGALCIGAIAVFCGFMGAIIKHENDSFDQHKD
ncbi:hypothetical protein [Bacterioplanoides sp.]|uniref:hypothetical protein n=1 Tax=Bacterioplanoides sp. TaxID=2066072 RepID=UPI003AFF89F2